MMSKNVTQQKALDFAVKIVKLTNNLKENAKDYTMSNQLLRSGTSIGANYSEAQFASSHKDFINKVTIALKEASETQYWLELLYKTDYLSQSEFENIFNECCELSRILASIVKTAKNKGM